MILPIMLTGFISKIMLDLILMASEKANIHYQLSAINCNVFTKNTNQLIVGLHFSKNELVQTSYASFTATV